MILLLKIFRSKAFTVADPGSDLTGGVDFVNGGGGGLENQ